MGSPETEDRYMEEYAKDYRKESIANWLSWERPRHAVLKEDFWITRNELTRVQNSDAPGAASGAASSLPWVDVDWGQARTACERLPVPQDPKNEWETPDLPTEAQWEYAAWAGSATRWSFGDDRGQLGDFAWFKGNAEGEVHPGGTGRCRRPMPGASPHGWRAGWRRSRPAPIPPGCPA